MEKQLEGRRAFITGTGGGQGRAAAVLFAAEGASVVGCDLDEGAAQQTVDLVRAAGGQMVSWTVDLGDGDQVRDWFEAGVSEVGGVDILYNNASAPRFAPIDKMTYDDWRFTMRNELDLIFWACSYGWPHLKESRAGVILNTASIAAHAGTQGTGAIAHAAAKAGVVGMTRQLAAEGAPHGIRANSLSPGTIDTPANDGLKADQAVFQRLLESHMIRRLGSVEEVARCARFLCSDDAGWITGADIALDGGYTAW